MFFSYGAFHLSAWNEHFPTTIERWLWRGAGLVIVGSPIHILYPAILALVWWPLLRRDDGENWADKLRAAPTWLKSVLSPLLGLLALLITVGGVVQLVIANIGIGLMVGVIMGRFYFLVEAFVSLRQPDPRIYDTVNWAQFWPHG